MVAQNIFFYVIAAVMAFSAIRVVTVNNVVHAAMYLVLVLAGVAAQYVLLASEFLAATQVLVYIGAIVVLVLFGVMLTRAKLGAEANLTNDYWYVGAFTAVLLFVLLATSLIDQFGDEPLDQANAETQLVGQHRAGVRRHLRHLRRAVRGRVGPAARRPRRGHRAGAEGLNVDDLMLNQFLLLSAILFSAGVYGVLAKRNAVIVLMSIELILNAVNINLVAFGAHNGTIAGSVFALFVIAVAAAEVGVGLAIVLLIYRNRKSVDLDEVAQMKG